MEYLIKLIFSYELKPHGRQSLIIPSKIQTYFMRKKPILCISKGACSELIQKNYCGLVCEDFQKDQVINLYKNHYIFQIMKEK